MHFRVRSGLVCLVPVFFALLSFPLFAQNSSATNDLANGLYAQIETSKGTIIAILEFQKAPLSTINFVGLAEGTLTVPTIRKGQPFYDGLNFHRVEDWVVQGGDPKGDGTGGPGYTFFDETSPDLGFDVAGSLGMAKSGPDTNGSQWFIVKSPAAFLNGGYNAFGHVVKGMDVVAKIAVGDKIKKVTIIRKGAEALAFKADQSAFDAASAKIADARAKSKASQQTAADADFLALAGNADLASEALPKAIKTSDGILYVVDKTGSGLVLQAGQVIRIHYTGTFLSGKVFIDNRSQEASPMQVGPESTYFPGLDEMIMQMKAGERRRFVLPPELGFGDAGYESIIPPKAFLMFDVEIDSVIPLGDAATALKLMPNAKKSPEGIYYIVDKEGTGDKLVAGKQIRLHYIAKFMDDKPFDSSRSGDPITIVIDKDKLLPGWFNALVDMKAGERRRVILPPDQAYGTAGYEGAIPPDTWLYFDLEVVDVQQ